MQRQQIKGIVLRRVPYGEADRIVTVLTPDNGKQSFIAKAVRKPKSKLASGIELFAVNDLTLLSGKGELKILISARVDTAFRNITRDYSVVEVAYRALEMIDTATEDDAPEEYYRLVEQTLRLLDEDKLSSKVIEAWLTMQFLQIFGNAPNVTTDIAGDELEADITYAFIREEGNFMKSKQGNFKTDDIKAWRVLLASDIKNLRRVRGLGESIKDTIEELRTFADYVRS